MTTIHIAASREYDVVIEPGLLTRLGTMAAELGLGRRAAVISDDAVFRPLRRCRRKSSDRRRISSGSFPVPAREQQKNLSTYGQVLNFLCGRRFTRSDFLVALGGGVVGIWQASPPPPISGEFPIFRYPPRCCPWWIPPCGARPP